ncbi:hypothetical protein CAEBREN_21651 [Caenorhabditis brenneri]|uniref:PDZ domain-containing protein n=1 Tax=Caenorhabditis brenneri TaxID=135651 RepID=G0MN35_CAEBE|nr:hypothetical protein CAEBREN_21651 [Caenorhabditis brenneri]
MKSSMNSVSFHGGVPRRVPTQEVTRKARSPKQPKKRASLSISEDVSEGMEVTANEEDNNTTSATMTLTTLDLNLNDTPPPPIQKVLQAPPTHFSAVLVEIPKDLRNPVFSLLTDRKSLNRNMVLSVVPKPLVTLFMSGDQICKVSGFPVWNPDDVTAAFSKSYETTVTVIRAWNLRCPSKDHWVRLEGQHDESRQYFEVTVLKDSNDRIGIGLASRKRQVVVDRIYAKTNMSTALLVGDQLLMIGNQSLVEGNKKFKKKQVVAKILKDLKTDGFVEIIACRPHGARTSPAPSLEAEQVEQYPSFAAESGDLNSKLKRKKERMHRQFDLPLPADSLEIAYRELTFLRELGFPDSDEMSANRGPSLFDLPVTTPDGSAKSVMTSPVSPSITPVSRTPATNQNSSWKSVKVDAQEPPSIQFNEGNLTESSNITSDVLEEQNLKKCDGKSGMVAYIKGKFSAKTPSKK